MYRSNIQIKSHGQKLVQRLDAGENIFAELEQPEARVLDKPPPHPTCTEKELPAVSYVSSSSSDEEDDCVSIDDYSQSSSTPDSMNEWYDDDKLKKEESIVVMALIELADHPTKLSDHITRLARATGPIATTFGVQL
jgi:hypothetical protein